MGEESLTPGLSNREAVSSVFSAVRVSELRMMSHSHWLLYYTHKLDSFLAILVLNNCA